MKYESPKISNEVYASGKQSTQNPMMGCFIPKGLMKQTYEIIEKLNKNKDCYHKSACLNNIEGISKEEIFNLSKELSDYNIGYICLPDSGEYLIVYPMETAEDYIIEHRILIYSSDKRTEELPIDIANMAKDGFKLVKFTYVKGLERYAAKFIK